MLTLYTVGSVEWLHIQASSRQPPLLQLPQTGTHHYCSEFTYTLALFLSLSVFLSLSLSLFTHLCTSDFLSVLCSWRTRSLTLDCPLYWSHSVAVMASGKTTSLHKMGNWTIMIWLVCMWHFIALSALRTLSLHCS